MGDDAHPAVVKGIHFHDYLLKPFLGKNPEAEVDRFFYSGAFLHHHVDIDTVLCLFGIYPETADAIGAEHLVFMNDQFSYTGRHQRVPVASGLRVGIDNSFVFLLNRATNHKFPTFLFRLLCTFHYRFVDMSATLAVFLEPEAHFLRRSCPEYGPGAEYRDPVGHCHHLLAMGNHQHR